MDRVPHPVHHPRPVEVDAGGRLVGKRVEAGPLTEGLPCAFTGMAADRLEQRMPGGHPFEVVLFRRLAVGGAARVTAGEFG